MKKIILVNIVSMILMIQSFAYAQGPQGTTEGKGMKGSMMGNKGMKMKQEKMMGMYPGMGMMRWMLGGQMVATKDGGIIVMMGNKLLKYDKDLNLKKEVEIKIDMEKVQKMMMRWQEECPMYKKMMEEGATMQDTKEEPKSQ